MAIAAPVVTLVFVTVDPIAAMGALSAMGAKVVLNL